jgi:hypothetical protein
MKIYLDKAMRGVAYLVGENDGIRQYEIRNREGRTVAFEEHAKGSKPSLCQIVKEPPLRRA